MPRYGKGTPGGVPVEQWSVEVPFDSADYLDGAPPSYEGDVPASLPGGGMTPGGGDIAEAVREVLEASKTYTAKQREKATTMDDGSFPIDSVADLERAVSSFGRAKDKDKAKAWIIRRAKALGATSKLPDGWNVQEAEARDSSAADSHRNVKCPECGLTQSATHDKCARCGHALADARKAKFAKTQEAAVAEAVRDALSWETVDAVRAEVQESDLRDAAGSRERWIRWEMRHGGIDVHNVGERAARVEAQRRVDEQIRARKDAAIIQAAKEKSAAREAARPKAVNYPDTPEGMGQFVHDHLAFHKRDSMSQMHPELEHFSSNTRHQAYVGKHVRPTNDGWAWGSTRGYEAVDVHDPTERGGVVTKWRKLDEPKLEGAGVGTHGPRSGRSYRERNVADKVSSASPHVMTGLDRARLAKYAKPLPEAQTLHHGSHEDFLAHVPEGGTGKITRSLSFTGREQIAKAYGHNTVLHVEAPKGTKTFRPTDVNRMFPQEDEHVLLKNTNVQVTKRVRDANGTLHVHAKIVRGGGSKLTEAEVDAELRLWLREAVASGHYERGLLEAVFPMEQTAVELAVQESLRDAAGSRERWRRWEEAHGKLSGPQREVIDKVSRAGAGGANLSGGPLSHRAAAGELEKRGIISTSGGLGTSKIAKLAVPEPGSGAPKSKAAATGGGSKSLAKANKRPYSGGSHVVLQHIGGGQWATVDGANSHEAAAKKAAKYPGETKVFANDKGAEPHPGTYTAWGVKVPTDHKVQEADMGAVVEAADSMAKASTPEPFSTSKTSNWVARAGGLPAYVQHIAHDLMEKRGKSESNAIQMAIGIVKRWCGGGGNVDSNTRAAACKAVSEWEAMKGKSKVKEAAVLAVLEAAYASDAPAVLAEAARYEADEQLRAGLLVEAKSDPDNDGDNDSGSGGDTDSDAPAVFCPKHKGKVKPTKDGKCPKDGTNLSGAIKMAKRLKAKTQEAAGDCGCGCGDPVQEAIREGLEAALS